MDRMSRYLERNRNIAGARRGAQDAALSGEAKEFRDDAGWRMTDTDYESYLGNEKSFKKSVNKAQGQLDEAQEKIDASTAENAAFEKALSGIDISNTTLSNSWNTYQKSFLPVRVVTNDNIEGTYYLPKEVIDKMDADSFNQKGGYVGNYVDGGKNYNVDTGGRGQELHDALRAGTTSVKAQFYEQNAGNVKKAQEGESTARAELGTANDMVNINYSNLSAEGDLLAAEGDSLSAVKKNRKQQKKQISKDYSTALAGRRQVLGVDA